MLESVAECAAGDAQQDPVSWRLRGLYGSQWVDLDSRTRQPLPNLPSKGTSLGHYSSACSVEYPRSVCRSVGLYVCLSLGQSVCGQSIYVPVCVPLSVYICLSICLSLSLSVCLFVVGRSVGRQSFIVLQRQLNL